MSYTNHWRMIDRAVFLSVENPLNRIILKQVNEMAPDLYWTKERIDEVCSLIDDAVYKQIKPKV
jgi:hypothetical protein